MGNRLAIAAVLSVLMFGAALFVYRSVFDEPSSNGQSVVAVAIDASVAHDASGPSFDAGVPPEMAGARLVEISGTVDRKQGKAWVPLRLEDEIAASDVIRTRADGRAVFEIADVLIELDSSTNISNLVASQVSLAQGRVLAKVNQGGFRVAVDGTDTVADTRSKGKFAVLADGAGTTSVATLEGAVQLTAAGQTQQVLPGQLSTVQKGAAPSQPVPIPASLFLKVKHPETDLPTDTEVGAEWDDSAGRHPENQRASYPRRRRGKILYGARPEGGQEPGHTQDA